MLPLMTPPHKCVHPITLCGPSPFVCHQAPEPGNILTIIFVGRALWHLSPFLRLLPFVSAPSQEFSYGTMYFLGWWKKKLFWPVKMIRQTLFRDVCNCYRISCIRSKRKRRFISQRTCLSGWGEPRMDSCLGKASKVRVREPCWTEINLAKDGMPSWTVKNLITVVMKFCL